MGTSGLGAMLVDDGLLTEADRRTIKRTCGSRGPAFARGVIALGLLDEDELAAFLAEKTHWRVASKDLFKESHKDVWGVIDRPLVERLEVLPLKITGGTLHVAMVDPLDQDTLRQLAFFTGYRIHPVISTLTHIRAGLAKLLKNFRPASSQLEDFLANHAATAGRRIRLLDAGPEAPRSPPQAVIGEAQAVDDDEEELLPSGPPGSGGAFSGDSDLAVPEEAGADLLYPDSVAATPATPAVAASRADGAGGKSAAAGGRPAVEVESLEALDDFDAGLDAELDAEFGGDAKPGPAIGVELSDDGLGDGDDLSDFDPDATGGGDLDELASDLSFGAASKGVKGPIGAENAGALGAADAAELGDDLDLMLGDDLADDLNELNGGGRQRELAAAAGPASAGLADDDRDGEVEPGVSGNAASSAFDDDDLLGELTGGRDPAEAVDGSLLDDDDLLTELTSGDHRAAGRPGADDDVSDDALSEASMTDDELLSGLTAAAQDTPLAGGAAAQRQDLMSKPRRAPEALDAFADPTLAGDEPLAAGGAESDLDLEGLADADLPTGDPALNGLDADDFGDLEMTPADHAPGAMAVEDLASFESVEPVAPAPSGRPASDAAGADALFGDEAWDQVPDTSAGGDTLASVTAAEPMDVFAEFEADPRQGDAVPPQPAPSGPPAPAAADGLAGDGDTGDELLDRSLADNVFTAADLAGDAMTNDDLGDPGMTPGDLPTDELFAADLSGEDLTADLSGEDLTADLSGEDLTADLSSEDLTADLSSEDLALVELSDDEPMAADLSGDDLTSEGVSARDGLDAGTGEDLAADDLSSLELSAEDLATLATRSGDDATEARPDGEAAATSSLPAAAMPATSPDDPGISEPLQTGLSVDDLDLDDAALPVEGGERTALDGTALEPASELDAAAPGPAPDVDLDQDLSLAEQQDVGLSWGLAEDLAAAEPELGRRQPRSPRAAPVARPMPRPVAPPRPAETAAAAREDDLFAGLGTDDVFAAEPFVGLPPPGTPVADNDPLGERLFSSDALAVPAATADPLAELALGISTPADLASPSDDFDPLAADAAEPGTPAAAAPPPFSGTGPLAQALGRTRSAVPDQAYDPVDTAPTAATAQSMQRAASLNRALLAVSMAPDLAEGLRKAAEPLVEAGLSRGLLATLDNGRPRVVAAWEESPSGVQVRHDNLGGFLTPGINVAMARLFAGWSPFGDGVREGNLKPFHRWLDRDHKLMAAAVPVASGRQLVVITAWQATALDDAMLRSLALEFFRRLARQQAVVTASA